jgi:site-specific DNA recombinase
MVPKAKYQIMTRLNQTPQRKQAVAYIRISSQRQINNESPATQRNTIQAFADNNDIEIVEWFEDIAQSGKNADRAGLQNLVKYCGRNRGKIQHWVVYNMKRASRDIDTYSNEIRTILKAIGVTIRSATEPSVDDTREGRFMESLLVALGQLDNEGKSDVTKDNMRSLALQGWWQHPPILGYDTHKKPNDLGKPRPTLKPNNMAPLIKQVLERYSEGNITKAELSRYASSIGLRSRYGKKLSQDRIHNLIKHPVYAGMIADNHTNWELIKGQHEAIISRDTYELNQTLLYGKRKRAGEIRQMINPDYPLKGLVLCPNCMKPLYASAPKTGAGGRSPRYHCSRTACKGLYKSIKASVMHDDFIEMLKRIKPDERVLTLYKEILIAEATRQLGGLNGKISRLRDKLDTIAENRLSAIKKFNADQLTIEEKTDLISSLDEEKAVINTELKTLEQQQTIRESDVSIALAVMRNVDEQWDIASLQSKIRFQNILFPEGLVYDYKHHRFGTNTISPLYRYTPNKKDLPESEKSFLVAGVGFEPTT